MRQTREFNIRVYKDNGYWWFTVIGYKIEAWPYFSERGARRAAKRWCRREVRAEVKKQRKRERAAFTYSVEVPEK